MRWRGLIIRNERMTIMELDQMLTAAANYGFPMLISCYLLVRMENKIDQLSANIDALTRESSQQLNKHKKAPVASATGAFSHAFFL